MDAREIFFPRLKYIENNMDALGRRSLQTIQVHSLDIKACFYSCELVSSIHVATVWQIIL